jgi:hypothetical protein
MPAHSARTSVKMIPLWLFAAAAFLVINPADLPSYSAPESNDVTAKFISAELIISNNTTQEVYYEVHEKTLLSRIDWTPICTDRNQISPKGIARLRANPYDFKPSGEAVIFWWHKGKHLMDKDHYGPDGEVRFITVTIR